MDLLTKALDALPQVAASPLALVGYVLTLAAWVYAISRSLRLKTLLARIKDVPAPERAKVIQLELGEVLPKEITAEQWIRSKKHRYYFAAFVLLLVTALAIAAMAIWKGSAQLSIDEFKEIPPTPDKKSELTRAILVAQASSAESSDVPALSLDRLPTEALRYRYTFDITFRNPSNEPVSVTEAQVIFDPGTSSGLANVQKVTGTYVVRVDSEGAAADTPLGRFQADAWYPNGTGKLIVKSPIAQTLTPKSVDRIRIIIEFPDDYPFRGKMEQAVLEVIWNGGRHERSKPIMLAKR